MKRFFVVPHSHLDREWYRTFQENRIKLTRFMDDLLETMDTDPDYTCYTLDAQTSFMDDYFDVNPQNEKKFGEYVKAGKLPIGPWYVQPDEHLPTAEGIIRNMLISKKLSDRYADYNRVGYVPDSFGQSSTMPTLLKGFGVDSAVIYRGFAEEDSKYNDFIWEGLDGSRILANWMPIGYGNAMFLNEDLEHNIQVIEENIELLEERSISENYLLMCGSDQSFVKKFLPKAVKDLNEHYKEQGYEFILAPPQEYIDAIAPYQEKMDVIKGELRKGKRSRTHNSIGATRMDVKKKNFQVETKYLYQLEPLAVLAQMIGLENDEELINRGWKYIVENHAHDSICCCCTDAIHTEILSRMEYARQLADYLIKEKLEALHERIAYKKLGRPLLLFSTCLHDREQLIEATIYVKDMNFSIYDENHEKMEFEILSDREFNLKDTKVSFTPIPDDFYHEVKIRLLARSSNYGYQTAYIVEGKPTEHAAGSFILKEKLNNGLMEVSIRKNGSVTVRDLTSGKKYENLNVFVDDGNAGDEYDYSPSYNDRQFTSLHHLKKVETEEGELASSLICTYEMQVPETTTNEERSENLKPLEITSIITLKKNDPRVYFHTIINNTCKNHRIQVYFNGQQKYENNIADIQLGEIKRENEFALTHASETEGWHERYYPVFNQHRYSGFHENGNGFVVMNKGLPQYEIIQKEDSTTLAVTLLSCVGAMGNTDLLYRPGRRSGSTDLTPASQMQGIFECEYAFLPIEDRNYRQLAENYVNPIYGICYAEYSCEGSLPDQLNLIESKDEVIITALKPAMDHDGYILRIENPLQQEQKDVEVKVNRFLVHQIVPVDLAERPAQDPDLHVIKLNNPDGSAKAVMSGIMHFDSIPNNGLKSVRIK